MPGDKTKEFSGTDIKSAKQKASDWVNEAENIIFCRARIARHDGVTKVIVTYRDDTQ